MVNVAQAWAEEYQTVNENVAVAVSGGGYITKPFSPNVLLTRIRAVLLRSSGQLPVEEFVEIADLRLYTANHQITVLSSSDELELGPTEFKILEFLMTHPKKV